MHTGNLVHTHLGDVSKTFHAVVVPKSIYTPIKKYLGQIKIALVLKLWAKQFVSL